MPLLPDTDIAGIDAGNACTPPPPDFPEPDSLCATKKPTARKNNPERSSVLEDRE